ncbi:hypothetical protein [Actinoallomurus soli]|uniref:hypothetical protein n=1 Tax=Actinoallomurus soli TaxID=2952535 RepID=UPI002093BCBC|nr:hypothetical protein [Actinoallomurus soli]MCO5968283.1 hypothetical protein [Actinoallomurus soli]
MGGMPASIMDIVDVIAVRHAHVATVLTVPMWMVAMLDMAGGFAFVDMVAVRPVQMPVVGIVDMVAVRHGDMPASLPVRMGVAGVLSVFCHRCHQ